MRRAYLESVLLDEGVGVDVDGYGAAFFQDAGDADDEVDWGIRRGFRSGP